VIPRLISADLLQQFAIDVPKCIEKPIEFLEFSGRLSESVQELLVALSAIFYILYIFNTVSTTAISTAQVNVLSLTSSD